VKRVLQSIIHLLIVIHLFSFFVLSISGFVEIATNVKCNRQSFNFSLISRRAKKRAGTRYHMRGADEQGNVANYVETEQILQFQNGDCTSFLQTRGSIPGKNRRELLELCFSFY
jgi:hypothetical protein